MLLRFVRPSQVNHREQASYHGHECSPGSSFFCMRRFPNRKNTLPPSLSLFAGVVLLCRGTDSLSLVLIFNAVDPPIELDGGRRTFLSTGMGGSVSDACYLGWTSRRLSKWEKWIWSIQSAYFYSSAVLVLGNSQLDCLWSDFCVIPPRHNN